MINLISLIAFFYKHQLLITILLGIAIGNVIFRWQENKRLDKIKRETEKMWQDTFRN